jgi:hypothetical protein
MLFAYGRTPTSITWYIKRLAAMSPTEIFFRITFLVKKFFWKKRALAGRLFQNCFPDQPWLGFSPNQPPVAPNNEAATHLLAEAADILAQRWNFFSLQHHPEIPLNWHHDPTSGISAPRHYSYDINHRDVRQVGNVKVIWEKSRHHHLTVLAAAFCLTRDERYAEATVAQLLDWIANNPCLIGINWTHPLELAIRLIAWTWCGRLLRGSCHYEKLFGPNSPIWLAIGQHQQIIAQTYSHGSSANNHLIGEMAGLFIASLAFPVYEHSPHWRKISQRILEREIVKQTFPSGLNREMAFEYHIFVAEFLLLALWESEQASNPVVRFSENFRATLKKIIAAIPALTDFGQHLPVYGDGDEGMALQLQSRLGRRDIWLVQLGAFLLQSPNPYGGEAALPLQLMGYGREAPATSLPESLPAATFADAGLYLLTRQRGLAQEIFVLADAGPLGYLSLAAHGHADALAFTLSAGGKRLLVDPGTFCYFTDPDWRAYFRSSQAHNTVVVDGYDQSTQRGTFLWSDKAECRVSDWRANDQGYQLSASHNGYWARLGVIHERHLDLRGHRLTIRDTLRGRGSHLIQLFFQVDPEGTVGQESGSCLQIKNGQVAARLTFEPALQVRIQMGDARSGWYSPHFGTKIPAATIVAEIRTALPVTFTTLIEVQHEG